MDAWEKIVLFGLTTIFFASEGLVLYSCGGDEGMPSCSEVVTHFYGQGCVFYNDNGPLSMSEFLSACRQMTSALPSYKNCEDDLKDFLKCLGGANDSTCSSCNDELDKLFYC